MELTQYIRVITRRWWLILATTVICTGSAVYYNNQQPSIYRSTAILFLSPAVGTDSYVFYYINERSSQLAQTYATYIKTQAFADLVIQRAGLDVSAAQLAGSVNARIVEGTQFFEITATANTAELAQKMAAAVANHFIDENVAQQRQQVAARRAASDVDNSASVLSEKLAREQSYYEEQVASLRTQISQIQNQPASVARNDLLTEIQEQLSDYESRLIQIMSDRVGLQAKLDESQVDTVTVVEDAPLPSQPVSNEGSQNLLFAAFAGLVLGTVLAFGLEYLDYTVKSPAELEQLVGQPPLGVLGISAGKGRDSNERRLIVLEEPRSPTAEAFRSIRTHLLFSSVDAEFSSLVVTSAAPGEGKTTVASNLAVTLANSGKNVILVDADMRRPQLHRVFELPNLDGLSNLILADPGTESAVLQKYLHAGPIAHLQILTSGSIPHNPAELLSAHRASAVLDILETQADIVIYDTPPALSVTDGVILARRADATLQVVRAGVTRRDVIMKTRETLARVGATPLAPVLNQVKVRDAGYYHGYYYGKYVTDGDEHSGQPNRTGQRRSKGKQKGSRMRANGKSAGSSHEGYSMPFSTRKKRPATAEYEEENSIQQEE